MPNLLRQLQQEGGDNRIDIGRRLMALGMAVMDPSVNTAGIEPQLESFLNKHSDLVDRKVRSLENHMNAYMASYRQLEMKMDNQTVVTPEVAKKTSPNVLEVSASVNVPKINEGDQEAVSTYTGRETKRGPNEILPENSHSEMRNIVMAASLQPTFLGSHMDAIKLSSEEANLLEGLN